MTTFVICVGSSLLSKTTDVTYTLNFLFQSPATRPDMTQIHVTKAAFSLTTNLCMNSLW